MRFCGSFLNVPGCWCVERTQELGEGGLNTRHTPPRMRHAAGPQGQATGTETPLRRKSQAGAEAAAQRCAAPGRPRFPRSSGRAWGAGPGPGRCPSVPARPAVSTPGNRCLEPGGLPRPGRSRRRQVWKEPGCSYGKGRKRSGRAPPCSYPTPTLPTPVAAPPPCPPPIRAPGSNRAGWGLRGRRRGFAQGEGLCQGP